MSEQFISQEKLEVVRKFLESEDLSNLPRKLHELMWRAKDLYAMEETPNIYITTSKYAWEDILVQFDENGEIKEFIISDDYSGECWSLKK